MNSSPLGERLRSTSLTASAMGTHLPFMVRFPSTSNESRSLPRAIRMLLNSMSAYFSTSKKSADCKCASRRLFPVLMLRALTVAVTDERWISFSSRTITPSSSVKRPFTLYQRFLTTNSTVEYAGSKCQTLVIAKSLISNCELRIANLSVDEIRNSHFEIRNLFTRIATPATDRLSSRDAPGHNTQSTSPETVQLTP